MNTQSFSDSFIKIHVVVHEVFCSQTHLCIHSHSLFSLLNNRKQLVGIGINELKHHKASILLLKLHFFIKKHIPKKKKIHTRSQRGTAIIMSSLAQSKSTIACHCRACLHVHQSVFSSASCRARDRAAPTFRFSKAQWVGASIHLHACRRTHTPDAHMPQHLTLSKTTHSNSISDKKKTFFF